MPTNNELSKKYEKLANSGTKLLTGENDSFANPELTVMNAYLNAINIINPKGSENLSEEKQKAQIISIFLKNIKKNKEPLKNLINQYKNRSAHYKKLAEQDKKITKEEQKNAYKLGIEKKVKEFAKPVSTFDSELSNLDYVQEMLIYAKHNCPEKLPGLIKQSQIAYKHKTILNPKNKKLSELIDAEDLANNFHEFNQTKFYEALVKAYASKGDLETIKDAKYCEAVKKIGYEEISKTAKIKQSSIPDTQLLNKGYSVLEKIANPE